MRRGIAIILLLMVALAGSSQESQGVKLQFDQSMISPVFTMPEMPMTVLPATNIKPVFNSSRPSMADLKLDTGVGHLTDSLAIYQQQWRADARPALPRFTYDTNPYGRDWTSSGVITRILSWPGQHDNGQRGHHGAHRPLDCHRRPDRQQVSL